MILRCPVCGKEVSIGAFKKTYVSNWNKKEYKLYHCEGCDLEWWEPLVFSILQNKGYFSILSGKI